MDSNQVNSLLKSYIKGQCTADELRIVEDWLARNWNENNEWKNLDESGRKQRISNLFNNIQEEIQVRDTKVLSIKHAWRVVSSIAAVLVLACGLYFSWPSLRNFVDPVTYKNTITASGQRKEVTLPDGTHLWLNSGSSLKYPEQFTGKKREVYLQGEAYFEVAHNAKMPFIVHTGDLETRVLGTVFNIRAYKNLPEIKVVLLQGKVELTHKNSSKSIDRLILTPDEGASYSKDGLIQKMQITNIDQYSAWKNGKFIFDETPMSEVLNQLNISYGKKVVLENEKIRGCKITGSFNINQKIEEILKPIAASINGKVVKESDQFNITGSGCDK